MNRPTSTLLLGAIIAMGFGIYGASEILDTQSPAPSDSSFLTGHLTLTAYNDAGDVIAYRQTDNSVQNVGDNCIIDQIFVVDGGDLKGCDVTADYTFILIGIGSDGTVTEADAQEDGSVALPITFSKVSTISGGVLTNDTDNAGADIVLTASFVDVNANINEAALRNANTATTGTPLAYQQFTVINLGLNDDLTVEWTITIDGT